MKEQEDILKEVLKSDLICSCKSPLHTNQKDREHFVSKISLSFPIKKAISLTAEKKDAEWIGKIETTLNQIDEFRKKKYQIHNVDDCECCEKNLQNIFKIEDIINKNLLAENQEENHSPKEQITGSQSEVANSNSSVPADIQEVCENCGHKKDWHYNNSGIVGQCWNGECKCKQFVPKKAEEKKKEMGK
jgi:hypothetical protein